MPDQAFSEMLGIVEIFYLKKCRMSYKEQASTFCIEFFYQQVFCSENHNEDFPNQSKKVLFTA